MAQTARRLAVSARTVREAIRTNHLPASRDMRTGRYWIPQHAIDDLIPHGINPAECLTPTQASALLGISPTHLAHLTDTGHLTPSTSSPTPATHPTPSTPTSSNSNSNSNSNSTDRDPTHQPLAAANQP